MQERLTVTKDFIDKDGFRANVGIVLCNHARWVLIARRTGSHGWQFPQGGIRPAESLTQAMYRELNEEIGLDAGDVTVLGKTQGWLRYRLPRRYQRPNSEPLCIGQKQVWFLLRLNSGDDRVQLDNTNKPEFDSWRWVDYWQPVQDVIYFKRDVYEQALRELEKHLEAKGQRPKTRRPRCG